MCMPVLPMEKPHIDMFASSVNHKLPLLYSLWQAPGAAAATAAAKDGLAQNWRGWYIYVFPPTILLLKNLVKIRGK